MIEEYIIQEYIEGQKLVFAKILRAADEGHKPAIEQIVKNFGKLSSFLESRKWLFEKYVESNTKSGVSNYYLGLLSEDNSFTQRKYFKASADQSFVLGMIALGDWYYNKKRYFLSESMYESALKSDQFDILKDVMSGNNLSILQVLHNNLSLCGWYSKDKHLFLKHNETARELKYAIAFNNIANGYFIGGLICETPDYEKALEFYKLALLHKSQLSDSHIEYIIEKISHIENK